MRAATSLVQDIRHGIRLLLKNPGFSVIAVLTLALGIGANTAIFSVVDAILLRPLPFPDPDRLVLAWGSQKGRPQVPFSLPNAADLRDQSRSFDGLGVWTLSRENLSGGGEPEQVQVAIVSSNIFSALGITPAAGRTFVPAEDERGSPRVAIVGDALWKRRFGSDPEAVGRSLMLDGAAYEVIGVLPAGFVFPSFPGSTEVWVPLGQDPFADRKYARGVNGLGLIARLKRDVSLQQAQAEVDAIAARLERQYPKVNEGLKVRLSPLREQANRGSRKALLLLLGAVGFVLLIACVNVANLLMARTTVRQRELAIRAALGASRPRLIRQLVTENVLLALLGGVAGVLVAFWGIDLLATLPRTPPDFFSPYTVPREGIGLDGRVLGFTFALSLLTGLGFGLVLTLRSSGVDTGEPLREGSSRLAGGGSRHHRVRSLLVVCEVALSLILLIGAGLMVKSFLRLERTDPGFRPGSVLTMGISLPKSKYPEAGQVAAFYGQLLERIRTLPGVESVGAVEYLPLTGVDGSTGIFVDGGAPPPTGGELRAHYRSATPDYFRAMGIPVLRGRPFAGHDAHQAARVAIVNEALARRCWPGEDPVGKRLALNFEAMKFHPDRPPDLDIASGLREVVGVVADVRHARLDTEPEPEMYVPHLQRLERDMTLVVRTSTDPASLAGSVQRQVLALDKDQPVANVTTMSRIVAASVSQPRFNVLLLSTFAAMALVLAALGVYGVMSYAVTVRVHEIGIRMALGARNADVLRLVVGEGMVLALAGVGAGLAGAFAVTRLLSGLLYEVSVLDTSVFAGTSLLLASVAFLACYLPARRAARVDPMAALRCE